MISDEDLTAAIENRQHWSSAGEAAVYAPPGTPFSVRVQAIRQPTRRERYLAAIVVDGQVTRTRPCDTAVEAVRWSEGIRAR
jgi:hypothetical protein